MNENNKKNDLSEKVIENNLNNYFKTKQFIVENDSVNNNVNNLNLQLVKIKRNGNVKNINNIKFNFDYKNKNKDNLPITLMHFNKK